MNRMTIDEAVEWLLSNTKQWNSREKVMRRQAVVTLKKRHQEGNLKELAKIRLIEKSGMFEQTSYYILKGTHD